MWRLASTAIIAFVAAVALIGAGSVWADPPGGFPNNKGLESIPEQHGKSQGEEQHGGEAHGHGEHGGPVAGIRFQDKDRLAVRNYYAELGRGGQCPPGLAKKENGCMPPEQARRWQVGAPLPRGVAYYSLPPSLVVQLTPPPEGYRYVRVASDILMIANGTGMVAAAIEDLGR